MRSGLASGFPGRRIDDGYLLRGPWCRDGDDHDLRDGRVKRRGNRNGGRRDTGRKRLRMEESVDGTEIEED